MKVITDPKKIEQVLTRRVEKVLPSKEGLKKLLLSGKRIRLYQGFDPSTPNLHIGHLVGLLKLKDFQQLGHEVIFLIGDFTGMIGDPTGKLKARKQLTRKEIMKNAETYKKQAGMVLDFSGEDPVRLMFNSEWNSKLKFLNVLNLASCLTVPQLLERDMFQERLKKGKDIYLHEFLYPLIQGYDSVAMRVDLEIGGSDQMFNMMVGRTLLHKLRNKEKFVLTTKLLVDSKGKKIGKTEGNVINIANPPNQFFAQIMSLTDEAIVACFELITDVPMRRTREVKKSLKAGKNPMEFKKLLAWELTRMLRGKKAADEAQKEFEKVHQDRGVPTKIPTFPLKNLTKNPINVIDLLVETKLTPSKSEAKRLITQKAVEINNQLTISNQQLTINSNDIIKVGKRKWIKIK